MVDVAPRARHSEPMLYFDPHLRTISPDFHDEVWMQGSFGFAVAPDLHQPAMVRQVHGSRIVEATSAGVQADGIWTAISGQTIAVQTADCVPVLLRGGGMAMAVHAGWRGLSAGILSEAVACFSQHGVDSRNVSVLIGPHICWSHFEVGPDVIQSFSRVLGPELLGCLTSPGERDRSFFNLTGAAIELLEQRNVRKDQMALMDTCTFCEPNRWPSYRRERSTGRILSWQRLP